MRKLIMCESLLPKRIFDPSCLQGHVHTTTSQNASAERMRKQRGVNMADTLQSLHQQQTRNIPESRNLLEKLTAWDTKYDPKAPLTDKQKDSFMELTTQWSNRPLPIEVCFGATPTVLGQQPARGRGRVRDRDRCRREGRQCQWQTVSQCDSDVPV